MGLIEVAVHAKVRVREPLSKMDNILLQSVAADAGVILAQKLAMNGFTLVIEPHYKLKKEATSNEQV